jgi:hypothetical protein
LADRPFAVLFTLGAAAAVTVLGIFASLRDGSWSQVPLTDYAVFHGDALEMLRALQNHGIGGFCESWVSANATHTPLVPAFSALLMFVFGPSRHVAEAVLPFFVWLLFYGVYRVTEILYDRKSAIWTVAVFATFPVVLNLSRVYLYELPFASFIVAGCIPLLSSDGFLRWKQSIAFGAFVGLASLARAAGGVLAIGPAAVVLADGFSRGEIAWRMRNVAFASVAALALMATWYAPNGKALYEYLKGATYGDQAQIFAGGSSFTLENAKIYIEALVYEGPGLPMALLGIVTFGASLALTRGTSWRSPRLWSLWTVFGINFLLLMIAAQRCGSILFVSVMPVIALSLVRANLAIPHRWVRAGGLGLLALLAAVNAIDCTFLFPRQAGLAGGAGPFAKIPLWSHRSMPLASVTYPVDPFADYKFSDVRARLTISELPIGANIALLADHPYVSAYAFRWYSLQQEDSWRWVPASPVDWQRHLGEEKWLEGVRAVIASCDAVLVRVTPWREPPTRMFPLAMAPFLEGANPQFAQAGEPIQLGDKSELLLYKAVHKRN